MALITRRQFAAASLALSTPAWAQGKPIRIIVPYAPGGPIDVTARALAERVKDSLGTVIIENRPGAGGNLGADLVAKAAPDGLTIGIAATATHAINPWLFAKMPYDASRDFAPITQMLRVPNVLVMNAETAQRLKINTLADLVAYAKANPAKLNFGSGGNGSAGHLAGEMFKRAAGIFAVHIPYNGGNPAQLALLSGKWTSTSTTWPRLPPTSRRVGSRPGRDHRQTQQRTARHSEHERNPERLFHRHLVGSGGACGHTTRCGGAAEQGFCGRTASP
jgi:tripartite-type tricarboxylate transporter receptor subunit TctC